MSSTVSDEDSAAALALKAYSLACGLGHLAGFPVELMPDMSLFSRKDPAEVAAQKAELACLAREREIVQVELDRYMQHRDAAGDETLNEWVVDIDPLTQDAVALSLMGRMQDGDKR